MTIGLKANVDGSGAVQTNGVDAIQVSTGQAVTFPNTANLPNTFGFKNRIINGDMRIDQRNAGASVTVNSATGSSFYAVDRFFGQGQATDGVFTMQRSTTAPAGFSNSLLITVTTADASLGATQAYQIVQPIEGFNVADLAWGTASAATVTLSFQARSSVTGTFGGAIFNASANRSYPFTYTINSANTFEQKSVTISGDTTGTWGTGNGVGMYVIWGLGVGSTLSGTAGTWAATQYNSATGATNLMATLSATFYITGVQLEKGSTATSFDVIDYGRSLIQCQRYYEKSFPQATAPASSLSATGANVSSATKATTGANQLIPSINFKATKRITPTTITTYSPTVSGAQAYNAAAGACSSTALYVASDTNISFTFTGNAGGTVADIIQLQWTAEAEL